MNISKICVVALVAASVSVAQESRTVRGEIKAEMTRDLSWMTVRLDPVGSFSRGETVYVSFGGEFACQKVTEGLYTLRVLDAEGNEILSQPLTVGPTNTLVSLRLPPAVAERPTGETTSVARLRHRPNGKALEAARKAVKFGETQNYQRAAAEWEKAVAADPEFSEAHGNLGAQYARLNRHSEAVEEFRRAIALDPHTAGYHSNLAVALAQLGQMGEAETWARRAVALDGSNALGHYVLGCVLTSRTTTLAEAIQQLQIAGRQLPGAHKVLANIYRSQGNQAMAIAEARQFEEARQSQQDHKAEQWAAPLH